MNKFVFLVSKQPRNGEIGQVGPQVGLGVIHLSLMFNWSSKAVGANLASAEVIASINVCMRASAIDHYLSLPDSCGSRKPSCGHPLPLPLFIYHHYSHFPPPSTGQWSG